MFFNQKFDIIVIGGGHAGTEAASASARMGLNTLLLTQNIETIGQMSCNPAIGGIGKGHLVKEIDALDGLMATAIDHSGIQFRKLNRSKGPAVQATRAQADRLLYKSYIKNHLENQKNLTIFQQTASELIIKNNKICGVNTLIDIKFEAKAVILTSGTFLNGKIHIGLKSYPAGRAGDPASIELANSLKEYPFTINRLKTGTPPRIDARTVDFNKMSIQHGDTPCPIFSFLGKETDHPKQIPCYITYTNEKTHDIIRNNLDKSPMYSGIIEGIGPRYCPSIEDKIIRFADKNSHQIFVEPEGLTTHELYPNGISTSLPFDVQQQIVNSMNGFENAQIIRPGYAIEYDYFDPRELNLNLMSQYIEGLFLAGQINGTTGYEEAASQGLLAGLNAGLYCKDLPSWIPSRDQAYSGVLIDDLTILGTKEPYRMFTSRAEYRLLLREDNADTRLTEIGYKLGLVSESRWKMYNEKRDLIEQEQQRLRTIWINPKTEQVDQLNRLLKKPISKESNGEDLLKRPEISYDLLTNISLFGPKLNNEQASEQVEILAKYEGYIKRQQEEIDKNKRNEIIEIPSDFDYTTISGLSNEVSAKLINFRPETVGHASRISGITPAAISILLVHLKKFSLLKKKSINEK